VAYSRKYFIGKYFSLLWHSKIFFIILRFHADTNVKEVVNMGKNKKESEKTTNREGESQKLGQKKNMPIGADRKGGKNSK